MNDIFCQDGKGVEEGDPFGVVEEQRRIRIAGLVAAVVEPFEELSKTERGRMLCHLLARTALPAGRVPNVSPWFGGAPFEVMLGRAAGLTAPSPRDNS
ncbi:hypothetical protein AB0395_38420 [Streptosporangium sp. NPDC051023]|uniref:hypothetical protein n=1 Tax=Streptosporangium sp. NPDC051023 TaxID=3155410 RepID=UPI00344F9BAF